jgi:pyridoxamine 5'-phosphate oxidase-like protein
MPTMRRRAPRGIVSIPVASRPRIEGYGIATIARGMVDWNDVRRAFSGAARYWIATTDADGSPHVQQHWGAFLDDRFYFEGGPKTRWARNLRRVPRAVVTAERLGLAIMLEGGVRAMTPAPELADRLVKAFSRKYLRTDKYKPSPSNWDNDGLREVTPARAFAWRYRDFASTATRFLFEKP